MDERGEIVIYQTEDGLAKLDVKMRGETVWLSLDQMALLFGRDKSTISRHIRNVFAEGELSEAATVANFATVQTEGGREVSRDIAYYNLDVIISVGYRVKSQRGVQFRIWATKVLKEYLRKGFALDDERLKGNGGGNCWKGRGQSRMTPQWRRHMPNTANISKRRYRQSKRPILTVSRPLQRQSRAKRGKEMPNDENKIIH